MLPELHLVTAVVSLVGVAASTQTVMTSPELGGGVIAEIVQVPLPIVAVLAWTVPFLAHLTV